MKALDDPTRFVPYRCFQGHDMSLDPDRIHNRPIICMYCLAPTHPVASSRGARIASTLKLP